MNIKFRIWDNQYEAFVSNASSLHCFSQWMIDAETGDVYDATGVLDGDHSDYNQRVLSKSEGCYMDFRNKDSKNGFVKGARHIIQQFVGLKDSKGKDIYEGDIVFAPLNKAKYIVKIGIYEIYISEDRVEKANGVYIQYVNSPSEVETLGEGKYVEVIGNIFEN